MTVKRRFTASGATERARARLDHPVIDSDGHQLSALDYVQLGVGQARRAWMTKADVVNTRTWKQIEKLRKKR